MHFILNLPLHADPILRIVIHSDIVREPRR